MKVILTEENQIALPKVIRDYLGLSVGDSVAFELVDDGSLRVRRADQNRVETPHGRFSDLVGINRRGQNTEALMELLRGYSEDSADPGFPHSPE